MAASRLTAFRWTAAILLTAAAILLVDSRSTGVGGADSAGYALTARQILERRIVVPIDGLRELGFAPDWETVFRPLAEAIGPEPGTMVPFYPPGFPLHIALAVAAVGWQLAPFLVSPLLGIASLVLAYFLGRELGLSRGFSLLGAVMLAGCSIFITGAVQPMSDVATLCWSTATILCALRARARGVGWAALSGAAFGVAVVVRPTSVLLAVPLAAALPFRLGAWALAAAGALPFGVFLGAWNQVAYGSPVKTGYPVGTEMKLAHLGPRVAIYARWIAVQFTPLVPLGWLGVGADRRVQVRDRVLLLTWFAGPLLLYSCWRSSASNWTYGRYLLPGAPALIFGFLLVLRDLAAGWSRKPVAAGRWRIPVRTLALCAIGAAVLLAERRVERRFRPLGSAVGQSIFPEACAEVAARAGEERALVVSLDYSAALRFYQPQLVPVRWDFLTPARFLELRARAAERGWRIFAVLLPGEVPDAIAHVPGDWRFLGNVRAASLWELPGRPAPASPGMGR